MIGKLIGGVVLVIIAAILFWLIWGLLTPWIVNSIPAGEWKAFMGVVVTIVVGWFGGIVLPLVPFVAGIIFIVKFFGQAFALATGSNIGKYRYRGRPYQ